MDIRGFCGSSQKDPGTEEGLGVGRGGGAYVSRNGLRPIKRRRMTHFVQRTAVRLVLEQAARRMLFCVGARV